MKRVAVPQTLQSRTINVRAGGGTCAMSSVQGKKEDERGGEEKSWEMVQVFESRRRERRPIRMNGRLNEIGRDDRRRS